MTNVESGLEDREFPHSATCGPPDWCGIGAMKSGTTWWHRNIIDHPNAVVAVMPGHSGYERPTYIGKQLHHFDKYCHTPFTESEQLYYYRHFPSLAGQVTGEWSPRYMYDFWTPPLLKKAAPDVKIIAILRNPVDRFESEMSHNVKYPERDGGMVVDIHRAEIWHEDAFFKGLYAQHLGTWLHYFDKSQMLILQYEKCVADFAFELRRTYSFLGLSQEYVPSDTSNSNPGGGGYTLTPELRDALRLAYSEDVTKLSAMFPEINVSLWEGFA